MTAVADNSDDDNNNNSGLGDSETLLMDESIWENGVTALYTYEDGEVVIADDTMDILVDKLRVARGINKLDKIQRRNFERNIKGIIIAYETGYTDEAGVKEYIETGKQNVIHHYDEEGNPIMKADLITPSTGNDGNTDVSNENSGGGTGNTGTTIAQQPTEGNQQSSGGDTQQPIIDNNNNTEVADNNQWNEAPEGTYESNVYQGDWTQDPEFRAAAEAQGAYIGTHEEIQAIIEYTNNHLDESKYEGVGIH